MRAILAALDFSPATDLIVAEAAKLARALQARVVLTTVLVEPVYVQGYAPPQKTVAKITVAHEQAVRKKLATLQAQLESEMISAQIVIRRGSPALHILAEAEAHDAAFIVIGSHGHTAFFELLLGSTTQAVLKRAQQPVLVIPPAMRRPRRTKGSAGRRGRS